MSALCGSQRLLMDKHLPIRGPRPGFALIPAHPKYFLRCTSRNPVPFSDIHKNNQINELDPGVRRGDVRGNQAVMIFHRLAGGWRT